MRVLITIIYPRCLSTRFAIAGLKVYHFQTSKDADLLQRLCPAGNILDRNIGYNYMSALWKNKRDFYWSIILTFILVI